MDRNGKIIVQPQFDEAFSFAESGLAKVRQNGKYGFINKQGEIVIQPQFDDAGSFRESRLIPAQRGKYGYIGKSGNIKIPFIYDDVWDFSDGLAKVRKNGKYGFIDKSGDTKIKFIYDSAQRFSEGLAKVSKKTLGIVHHIVTKKKDGKCYGGKKHVFDKEKIPKIVENLNKYFTSSRIAFFSEEILDDDLRHCVPSSTGKDISLLHEIAFRSGYINIYHTFDLEDGGWGRARGVAYGNAVGIDYDVLDQEKMEYANVLAHEMGHSLGLRHTHGPSNGDKTTELLIRRGGNCSSEGDSFCDTPADPNEWGR